jgi:hypothetical protein
LCSSTEIAIDTQSTQMQASPVMLSPMILRFAPPQKEHVAPLVVLRNHVAHVVQIDTPGPLATKSRSILQKVQIMMSFRSAADRGAPTIARCYWSSTSECTCG